MRLNGESGVRGGPETRHPGVRDSRPVGGRSGPGDGESSAEAPAAGTASLSRLLGQLIEEIDRFRHAGRPSPRGSQSLLCYRDVGHVYMEVDVPGPPEVVADVSVVGSRVFIRLVR
ncbi:hypothetical protein OJF2_04930 [Aquisphaera giovannonii]|uniref:Uncharacterized protein n=1 Tax=Aquisphaera giovannonii TaxID=406548 RepID=A0A5B9VVC8_9BACT|nr:hypothetical protein [Aquisphaera giovannonii]QEH32024.1 hypothetical protein OJF2_04930 [Aquisphaera giovannonii]